MTHPLKTYLERHEITAAEFAECVSRHGGGDIKASYISQIIIGYRRPGGALCVAIADASSGHVSVDDLLRFSVANRKRTKRAA